MIVLLNVATAIAASVWVAWTWQSRSRRWQVDSIMVLSLQLALLALVRWGDGIDGLSTTVIQQFVLSASVGCLGLSFLRSGALRLVLPWWLVMYLMVLGVGAALSSNSTEAAVAVLRYAAILTPFLFVAGQIAEVRVRRILAEYIFGLASVALLQAVLIPGAAFREVRAPVLSYRLIGATLVSSAAVIGLLGVAMILIAAVSFPASRRGWQKIAASAVGVTLVAASQSRTTVVIGTTFFVVWAFLHLRRSRRSIALVGVFLVAVTLLVLPETRQLWDREAAHPESANAASYRSEIFRASVDRFSESPIVGGGLAVGNVGLEIPIGRPGTVVDSHSELGTALAASGLVGAVAIAWAHLAGLTLAWSRWRTGEDAIPLILSVGMMAATPFTTVIVDMSKISLPFLLVVLPLFPVRQLTLRARR